MDIKLVKIIKNEKQYEKVLARIDELLTQEDKENDELKILSLIVDDYEKRRFKTEKPDPIEAVLFRMDQMGLKQKDLAGIIGSVTQISEVLNRKKKMSLNMIRKINSKLGIPLEILLNQKDVDKEKISKKRNVFTDFQTVGESKVTYKGSREETKPVTIRFSVNDLEKIKQKAEKEGIPYQRLIKMVLKKYIEKV